MIMDLVYLCFDFGVINEYFFFRIKFLNLYVRLYFYLGLISK